MDNTKVNFGWLGLASGSSLVCAFAHGAFNAGPPGFWAMSIVGVNNPILGGITGVTGLFAMALLAIWLWGRSPALRREAALA